MLPSTPSINPSPPALRRLPPRHTHRQHQVGEGEGEGWSQGEERVVGEEDYLGEGEEEGREEG